MKFFVISILIFALFAVYAPNANAITPKDLGLNEGDVISATGDPDIYIVNEHGYKRLFLNPVIFNFYGHLGGFENVKNINTFERDTFKTTTYFQNCETGDPKIYATEVTGEDIATLHWLDVSGEEAVAEDPNFFEKVFCINNNEFNWYSLGSTYTSLSQVPEYKRSGSASMILPYDIGDTYNTANKAMGELSFAGSYIFIPFGGDHFDYWVPGDVSSIHSEVVPGTVLRAPISGTVTVAAQELDEYTRTAETTHDYEIHFAPTGNPKDYWVEYDHVVDVLVKDGQTVQAGDPVAKAAPASIRHGGAEGEKPVDEFEWSVKIPSEDTSGGFSVCPLRYLSEEDKNKILNALDVMAQQGFDSGESVCMIEQV